MQPMISIRGLTKEFALHSRKGPPSSLREILAFRRQPRRRRSEEHFFALKNVSFDIGEGEVISIIGRNGAGKSTLLKILARILRPTSGRVELRGRVGSLLEAGTGFHGDMTGRENIHLNAAILGMTSSEIRTRFDSIVDFAGVDRFVDTPVKYYSTGMYMRLAFSVAAHMEPEILLVDEVLSVGDAAFQKKCLARIEDVSRHGRTVLFVSHDLQTVSRLCRRAVLLDSGELVSDGPIHEVLAAYLGKGNSGLGERNWPDGPHAPGDGVARLRSVRVISCSDQILSAVNTSDPFAIEMMFDVIEGGLVLFPVIHLLNAWSTTVIWSTDVGTRWHGKPRPAGRYRAIIRMPANLLAEGTMTVSASVYSLQPEVQHFHEADAVTFQVLDKMESSTSRGEFTGYINSVIRPQLSWTVDYDPASYGSRETA